MSAVIVSAIATKITELAAAQAKANELTESLNKERNQALRELPAQFGYASNDDFIAAFREANSGPMPAASRNGVRSAVTKANGKGGKKNKRNRTSLIPERREEIKRFLKANQGMTALEQAQHFAPLSVATIQNLRKEAGLVKSR